MRVPGSWKEGYVLDYHTKGSDFLGYDEYGHPRFHTVRTEVGELLYRLKYKGRKDALDELGPSPRRSLGSGHPRSRL